MYSIAELERLLQQVKIERPCFPLAQPCTTIYPTFPNAVQNNRDESIEEEMLYRSNEYVLGKEEEQFVDGLRSLGNKLGMAVKFDFEQPNIPQKKGFDKAARPRRREKAIKKCDLQNYILSRILNVDLT